MPLYRYRIDAETPGHASSASPGAKSNSSEQLLPQDYVKRRRVVTSNMRWTLEAVHIALMELIKYRQTDPRSYYNYVKRLPNGACDSAARSLRTALPDIFGSVRGSTLKNTFRAWVRRQSVWQDLEESKSSRTLDGAWLIDSTVQARLVEKHGEENVLRVLELREPLFPFKFELEFLSLGSTPEKFEGFVALMRKKTQAAYAKLAEEQAGSASAIPAAVQPPEVSEGAEEGEGEGGDAGDGEGEGGDAGDGEGENGETENGETGENGADFDPVHEQNEPENEPIEPETEHPALGTLSTTTQQKCAKIGQFPVQDALISLLYDLRPELSIGDIDKLLLVLSVNERVAVTAINCSARKTRQELVLFLQRAAVALSTV